MWAIYSRAAKVLIWLGPDDGTMGAAIRQINDIFKARCENGKDIREADNYRQRVTKDESNAVRRMELTILRGYDWTALESFFSCAWFQRLWVLQETVLAKDPYCIRGEYTLQWDKVGRVAQELAFQAYSHDFDLGRALPGIDAAEVYERSRKVVPEFRNLLKIGSRLRCSDPRDNVYGLLGVLQAMSDRAKSQDQELLADLQPIIKPDYSKPVETVYSQATRAAIVSEGDLFILQQAQFHASDVTSSEQESNVFPSWVPRFDLGLGVGSDARPPGTHPLPPASSQRGASNGLSPVFGQDEEDDSPQRDWDCGG